MKYTEPEITAIIDPFDADILGDGGGTLDPVSQIGLTAPAGLPVLLPDGTETSYDEFGEIIDG